MFDPLLPPLRDTCHRTLGDEYPVASAWNVTFWPATATRGDGCSVTVGRLSLTTYAPLSTSLI